MRKMISILASLSLAGSTAFAAPAVTSIDANANIINISGDASSGDIVSILVVNPGYSLSDVYTNPAVSQQYVKSYVTDSDSYSFDIKINTPSDGGGTYEAVVNVGGKSENFTFSFYPIEAKLDVIDSVKKAKSSFDLTKENNGESVVRRAIGVFGLSTYEPAAGAKESDIASLLMVEASTGIDDADDMYNKLKAAIIVAALNNSDDVTFKNGYLSDAAIFELDADTLLDAYTKNITKDGLEAIKKAMLGKNFKTVNDAADVFEDSIVLNLITNNVKYGNGHVEDVLNNYSVILSNAGFKLSKLSNISKKSKLYDVLVSSNAKTLEELAGDFNSYKEQESSGGGGSRGSSGSVSSVPSYAPSFIPNPASNAFADVDETHWANEAITTLRTKGIINGRGGNLFEPGGTVTRAEFVKMVMGASSLTNPNAICAFNDVVAEWAKVYVASAADLGIVTGMDGTKFAPDSPITREQGVTIIYRTLKTLELSPNGDAITFDDADIISDYAKEAVGALCGAKIINGKGNNLFAPLDNLTRAEAAKLIYGAFSSKLQ